MKNPFDKIPPQDLDAERAVLGSVMIDHIRLDEVSGILKPEMFYLDAHVVLFSAMLAMRDNATAIDSLSLSSHLERSGKLREIGGNEYLIQCVNSIPHAAHAKYHAVEVKDRWTQRTVIYTCTQLLKDAYDGSRNGIELAQSAMEEISRITEMGQESNGRWFAGPASEAMERHFRDDPEGIPSGLSDLDASLSNWKRQSLYILAARPGMGKTSLAEVISYHWAKHSGPVAFFSLEMNEESLFDRFTISHLGVSMRELREHVRNNPDRAGNVFQELSELPLFVNPSPSQSMASITAQSRMLKRQSGLHGIVIDHLLLVEPEDRRAPREAQVGLISWRAKQLAKSLEVPVLMLTQLNRECDKRPDKKPVLSDLRSSGEIEQNADCVLLLYRPWVYFPDDHKETEAEIIIPKNRFGSVGSVNLIWNGPTMSFKGFGEETTGLDLPEDMFFN